MDNSKEMEINVRDNDINKADLPKDGGSDQKDKRARNRNRNRNKKDGKDANLKGVNDPSFYYDEVQILNDMASIPTAYATGLPVKIQTWRSLDGQ